MTFTVSAEWQHDAYQNYVFYEFGYYYYNSNGEKLVCEKTKKGNFPTKTNKLNWNNNTVGNGHLVYQFTVPRDESENTVILPFFKLCGLAYPEDSGKAWETGAEFGTFLIYGDKKNTKTRNGIDNILEGYCSSSQSAGQEFEFIAARVVAGSELGNSDAAEYGLIVPPRGAVPSTPIQSIIWPTQNEPNKVELKWTYGSISTSPSNEPVSYTISVRKNGQDINNLWEDVFSDELNDVTEGSIGSYVYEMSPNGRYEYQLTLHSNAGSTTVNFDNAIVYSQPVPPVIEYAYVSGGKLTCQINNEVNVSDDLASSGTQISPWSIDNAADDKEVRVRAYFEQDNKTIYSDYSTGIIPVKVIIPWLNIDYQFNQE